MTKKYQRTHTCVIVIIHQRTICNLQWCSARLMALALNNSSGQQSLLLAAIRHPLLVYRPSILVTLEVTLSAWFLHFVCYSTDTGNVWQLAGHWLALHQSTFVDQTKVIIEPFYIKYRRYIAANWHFISTRFAFYSEFFQLEVYIYLPMSGDML